MSAVKFDTSTWLGCEVMTDDRSTTDGRRSVNAAQENGALSRPFFIDPPGPDAIVRGIVCLDFDGVLNKLGPCRRDRLPQVVKDGRSWGIDLVPDMLTRLDAVIQRPGIWLAWVTTWGSQIALIRPLFDGHLEGGFVPAGRPRDPYVDTGWKEHAVVRLAEQFADAKLAWIDDTAVSDSFRSGSATRNLPEALLIAPNPSTGLQVHEIATIEEYFGVIR